jgi:outer membrane protein insertion porin family
LRNSAGSDVKGFWVRKAKVQNWWMCGWRPNNWLSVLALFVLFVLLSRRAFAEDILSIEVEGPRAVQVDAITELMDLKVGSVYQPGLVREDIKRIFESGFFDDVQVRAVPEGDGVRLVVLVTEKPSVREIRFVGFNEIDEDTVQEKLQTKQYTIINDSKLNADLRTIEQLYVEKGYYLARASYAFDRQDSGEVVVIFSVLENNKVSVGRVNLLGNMFFSDNELSSGMFTRRQNWTSGLFSAGTFKDEFVNRDKEFLAYYYKDNGFAEATVSAPASRLDADRQNVEVSYYIEEGERFDIGSISFRGDLIQSDAQLREQLSLQPGSLFRISKFQKDLQTLQDVYGDEGYAFADILPRTTADREKRLIDIDFEISKGEKVYFRKIEIVGNSKTRDNVIRRNMRVSEGELFHSTRLRDSKARIERLGFFEDVQIQRLPDAPNRAMDLQIKVKEKSTGSLSASIGATPDRDGQDFSFFAQGKYTDANLLGKGWSTSLSFDIIPPPEKAADIGLGLNASFREPSINDGPWSLSLSGSFKRSESRPFDGEPLAAEEEYRAGVYLGRSILGLLLGRELLDDDLRATIGYSFKLVERPELSPVFERTQEKGITHSFVTSLTYDKTNNYLFPTDGYYLSLENTYATQFIKGDHEFGRVEFTAEYYIPLVFGDDFVTNFRLMASPGLVYPVGPQPVPIWERYRLGSQLTMKAYKDRDRVISPRETVIDSPYSSNVRERPVGGNRRLYASAEYFVPLIPEANLRFVTFGEAGTVLNEDESFEFEELKYDVGFGFRWMTPIAPFRFEFAFPVEERKLGQSEFVIFIGGDTASRF